VLGPGGSGKPVRLSGRAARRAKKKRGAEGRQREAERQAAAQLPQVNRATRSVEGTAAEVERARQRDASGAADRGAAPAPVGSVAEAVEHLERAERALEAAVRAARARGCTWAELGPQLHLSPEVARRRFAQVAPKGGRGGV
jgi:hypothetical protein